MQASVTWLSLAVVLATSAAWADEPKTMDWDALRARGGQQLVVTHPGAEPLIPLRLTFEAGDTQSFETVTQVTTSIQMSLPGGGSLQQALSSLQELKAGAEDLVEQVTGETEEAPSEPPSTKELGIQLGEDGAMRTTLDLTSQITCDVSAVDTEGARIRCRVTDVTTAGAGPIADMTSQLMKATPAELHITPQGNLLSITQGTPGQPSPADALGSAAAAAPWLGPPLPDVPVGPGATWTQHQIQEVPELGSTATTTHWTFQISDAGAWVLSSSSKTQVLPSTSDTESALRLTATTRSTWTLDPASGTPLSWTQSASQHMEMSGSGMMGMSQVVDSDTQLTGRLQTSK